jgi:hypothetical protein
MIKDMSQQVSSYSVKYLQFDCLKASFNRMVCKRLLTSPGQLVCRRLEV